MVLIQGNIQTMIVYFYYICVHQWSKLGILILTRIILEVVLNVAVLFLFVHKLWQQVNVMIMQDRNDEFTNKPHTIRLIQVVTRYFLLSFIMITFNSSFYITSDYVISDYYLGGHSNDSMILADIYLIYVVRAFELTLISITLFLNFGFNKHLYRKLCGKCHRCCLKACVNLMTVKYKRRMSKEIAAIDGNTDAFGGLLLVHERALTISVDDM